MCTNPEHVPNTYLFCNTDQVFSILKTPWTNYTIENQGRFGTYTKYTCNECGCSFHVDSSD